MRIAIIGGSGKMGQWSAEFLLKNRHDVLLVGRSKEKLKEVQQILKVEIATDPAAVMNTDVVMFSAPMDHFEEAVRQYQSHIYPHQSVMEITSVKVIPVDVMHRCLNTKNVLSVHPMFGLGAKDIKKHNFISTPTTPIEDKLADKVQTFIEARGARISLMTPGEHDDAMAVVLGLPHIVALISADALLSVGGFGRFDKIGGTTCKLMMMLADSVLSEDRQLYASLQMNLQGMGEIHNLLQTKLANWAEIVARKDRQQFIAMMEAFRKQREGADPNFRKAYDNMYRLEEHQL